MSEPIIGLVSSDSISKHEGGHYGFMYFSRLNPYRPAILSSSSPEDRNIVQIPQVHDWPDKVSFFQICFHPSGNMVKAYWLQLYSGCDQLCGCREERGEQILLSDQFLFCCIGMPQVLPFFPGRLADPGDSASFARTCAYS